MHTSPLTPTPTPNQAEFLHRMLLRGTNHSDDDGLLLQIRALQLPRGLVAAGLTVGMGRAAERERAANRNFGLRSTSARLDPHRSARSEADKHAAAAAVLAADPLDDNGESRRQARAAEQRANETRRQNHAVSQVRRAEAQVRRAEVQEVMNLQRVRERDAREAEPEGPGAARLAGARSCDPSRLGVEEYGGGIGGGGRGEGGGGKSSGGGGGEGAATPPLIYDADETMAAARTNQLLWRWRSPLVVVTSGRGLQRRRSLQRLKKDERLQGARARVQQRRLAEVVLSTEEKAQLTEALDEGEQAVAELQQGGSPADASRIMSLQQKVALGTSAKQRLTGDAHASLTGGKALRPIDSERLFSDALMLPRLVERELPSELQWRATRRGIGLLARWSTGGPAAQASGVADAMTQAVHMPDLHWRGLLGKRTREAAGLPGKLSEYEGQLRKQQRETELSKWQHGRCEARVGGEHTCTICQELIEGDAGALGCAEGVAGATDCAGRFCAACLPVIGARIAAGDLRSCPNCRSFEPSMGQAGAGASLRLCRNFVASSTENAFESIELPPPPPPRDESAGEARRLQGEDDAQMAARLQQEEQAVWLRELREERRRQLEERDARDARETAQEQEQLRAQRASAPAARAARGTEGGSSTAAERLQREAEASALGGGAAGGGASSSLSSPDATSAAPQSPATPPPTTTTPNAATLVAAPQHDAATHLLTTTSEGTTFGGADTEDAALDSDVQPDAGNPSPNHTPAPLPLNPIPYPKP